MKILETGLVGPMPTSGGAYMPAVTPLPSGELIGTRFVASTLVAPDGRFEVFRSQDGGQSWTDPVTPWPDDGWSYRTPHIYEAGDARLLITGTRFETDASPTTFDPASGTVQRGEMFIAWSEDNGHSWGPPTPIPSPLDPDRYSCNGSGVLLVLSDDRWMYPFETWLPTGATTPLDQKAAAMFSSDQGRTWGEMAVVADDPSGRFIHWDHCGTVLPASEGGQSRIYETMWVRDSEANADLPIHFTVSDDQGRTWADPRPTGLRGQASAPISLPDGRVAVLYTHRTAPEGVRLAVGYERFEEEIVVFDAGDEALLQLPGMGDPDRTDALATNMAQGFGKMGGFLTDEGDLMVTYWGTVDGVSHCRWALVRVG